MDSDDREGGMAVSRDWWESGWHALLPRQALFIDMVVSTASMRDIDGDFPRLAEAVGIKAFELNTGGLQEPIWWSFPDTDEDDAEQGAIDIEMRREFELTMGRAGREIPTTVLELAFLMADLGLYDRKIAGGVEGWRKVIPTPLASETLPVSEEFAKREDESRWSDIEEESAQMILRYMIDDLGSPPMIETSLALLAEKIGLEVTDLRFGLNGLAADGFEIVESTSLKRIDPETVDEQMIVCLLVDWLLFSENRIGIVFEHRNDHGEF